MRLKTGGKSQAAYLKSRCAKAKCSLLVMGKRRHEWRLNHQQQALPEIRPMSLLGLTRSVRHAHRSSERVSHHQP
jgi:hypothetical protein